MTTITREQLRERAREKVKSLEFAVTQTAFAENRAELEEELELARIALASLEAEAVYQIFDEGGGWFDVEKNDVASEVDDGNPVRALYTAPPAPVVDFVPLGGSPYDVPYSMPSNLRELIAEEIGILFSDDDAQSVWNVCRGAALLQGSQPVSNRDELPVIGWLRSDYNSDDKRDPNAPLFMLGSNDPSEAWGVKYIPLSGNSPVIPDGWKLVPVELTGAMTNAMTDAILDDLHNVDVWRSVLSAAPHQEAE